MAAQTYTTTQAVSLATLAPAYRVIEVVFAHLALIKEQQGINCVITALALNADNTVSITFSSPLPLNAAQLAHLGIA